MFTQPCFIRRNTPELREELESLEIYEHPSGKAIGACLFVNRGFYSSLPIGYTEEVDRAIDCGTNEKLFLALSALRDDIDINQWFIMDMPLIYKDINAGDWFLATDIKGGKHIGSQIDPLYCHKATPEELIEHFK